MHVIIVLTLFAVCNTESANNWDYSYYLPHYGYPFNHKNTGHGNHHSPKTSYNSKYHTGPLLSYITPYRFVGKPPLKARKPFGCEAVQLNMVFR